jgi:hypothetical protein
MSMDRTTCTLDGGGRLFADDALFNSGHVTKWVRLPGALAFLWSISESEENSPDDSRSSRTRQSAP